MGNDGDIPTATREGDLPRIHAVLDTFFAAFTSGPGLAARMEALRAVLLPEAVVVKTCGGEPVVYDVEGFLTPRITLLTSGGLVGFREWRQSGHTEVFGQVAHWFGSYAKEGTQDGVAFTGRGMKSVQLVRTAAGWRISAAAWDDERDGLGVDLASGSGEA